MTVVNDASGETESVILTEDPGEPGTFAGSLATAFGTSAGVDNDGNLNTQAGDTLSAIAQRVYQNPALWRPIALNNDIDDPRVLPVGAELLGERDMHRHVQPGVGLAVGRCEVALQGVVVGQLGMVLGMLCDDPGDQLLEWLQRLSGLAFLPRSLEKAA